MIYTILVALLVLGVLIFFHELGHFLAAKLVGIQVLRFSIGLGKPLLAYRWGETEYALAAIPFGGYVKMAGDDPVESLEGQTPDLEKSTDPKRHFDRKSIWARSLVIFAGPLMNFVLAAVLYIGIFYFQGADTIGTVVIDSVNQELALPGMEKIVPGSKVLSINGTEPENWNDIRESCLHPEASVVQMLLWDKKEDRRYALSFSVPDDSTRQRLAYALNPLIESRVGEVIVDKPAYRAGIQTGDLFLRINDQDIKNWDELTEIIHQNPGDTVSILLERGSERIEVEVVPESVVSPQPDRTFKTVGKIGIGPPRMVRINLTFVQSVTGGVGNTIFYTDLVLRSLPHFLVELISGRMSFRQARDALGGPIMIGKMVGEAARGGWLFNLMAFVSLNLALLNLLPIPVLDGGHLLFILIEVIRFGKPLSPEMRVRWMQVGMVIIFTLMIYVVFNDLSRIFSP
ncbi:MAG: RIP metalloprotease RseP [Candidatus Glassbacteria bacterium]|nr:RIP metalloprotease RseP [Candidatus Glassbacteria bacterium]